MTGTNALAASAYFGAWANAARHGYGLNAARVRADVLDGSRRAVARLTLAAVSTSRALRAFPRVLGRGRGRQRGRRARSPRHVARKQAADPHLARVV